MPSSPNRSGQPPLSPSKMMGGNNLAVDTRDDPNEVPTKMNSLQYSETYGSSHNGSVKSTSDNDFSVDRYADASSGGVDSLATLSIERTDTDRELEKMMAKFDVAQKDNDNDDAAPGAAAASNPGTPRELNRMLEKFDLLQQDTMDSRLTDANLPTSEDLYRDNRQFAILSPGSQTTEGFEVDVARQQQQQQHQQQLLQPEPSTSYSSAEMFEDLEQFRSADSHSDPTSASVVAAAATAAAAAVGAASGASCVKAAATNPQATAAASGSSPKILEQRIVKLMNKVSKLELEKDELRSQKDDLQSQLRDQHDRDVQDMYQNPYSDPFAGVATPTKSKGGGPSGAASAFGSFGSTSFLESATSNLQQQNTITSCASMGAVPSTIEASSNNNAQVAALHTELTELRMKNQTLQTDLETSDRVKDRLKKVLKQVQEEDQQKLTLLKKMTQDLEESLERESVLKTELDECKVRLSGFEMAQKSTKNAETPASSPSKPASPKRRGFFSSSSAEDQEKPTQTGDVATALVVSQKQNEALEAFNKELELQNTSLQKKCDTLTEKYGLSEPEEGDDKGKQLYSRYLEMKSSLSSLSVVLEEAKDNNTTLTKRVTELETELSSTEKQQKLTTSKSEDDNESVSSSSSIITPEQEKALKALVQKLEVQILGYRDAEQQHQLVQAELEATVDRLDREASVMRQLLEADSSLSTTKAAVVSTTDLEQAYEALAAKLDDSSEWKDELGALKVSMDEAAAESTRLLNELEAMLSTTQKELETERTKYSNSHHSEEKKDDRESLRPTLSSEQRLLDEVASLQKQTKQLRADLQQKTARLEKSEKRVATKHEQALQLTKANESLREGIQKLKIHLSFISEQANKTEVTLAETKLALDAEKETTERLEVERRTLQTKIDVLQKSISDGSRNVDEATSNSIELQASLAASREEVLLARERVQKLLDSKQELEFQLATTRDDLQTKLHSEHQRSTKLAAGFNSLEGELQGTRLLVAAATRKLVLLEEAKLKDGTRLQEVLKSTREMSKERIKLSDNLKNTKEQLEVAKKDTEGLTAIKTRLETRVKGSEQCLEDARNLNASLMAEARESTHQFEELEKLLATTQEELNEEEQRVETLEKEVDEKTSQIRQLEQTKSSLEVSLNGVKHQLFTLNAKNKTLECQLQAEKDYNSNNDEAKLLGLASKSDGGDDEASRASGVTQKLGNLIHRLQGTESSETATNDEAKAAPSKDESNAAASPAALAPIDEDKKDPASRSIFDTATLSSGSHTSHETSSSETIRRWEAELLLDNTKRDLEDALKENTALAGKVDNLETSVEKSQESNALTVRECETHAMVNKEMAQKIDSLTKQVKLLTEEKEGLMKRTAALARRDQLQKASLQTSNDEVATLMNTMSEFQQKFELLAEQVERGEAEKMSQIKEYEDAEAKWITEMADLNDQITKLQTEYNDIKAKHDALDKKHMQVLMKEQSSWQSERIELNSKIAHLEKKDSLRSAESNEPTQMAADSYYPLRQAPTDRSLMNQKVGELEQDIQLLEVTMNDAKQEHLIATAELEVTKFKLSSCQEELEAAQEKLEKCEFELTSCRANLQTVVLKSVTDTESFKLQIGELEEELKSAKKDHEELETCHKELESSKQDHSVTQTVLEASKGELERYRTKLREAENDLQLTMAKNKVKERDNTKAAEERESDLQLKHNACLQELKSCQKALKTMAMAKATEIEEAIEQKEELQKKFDECSKELKACREELDEKEKVMKHIAKKQVVEHQENDDEIRKNKTALVRLTEELNEAHIREKELEDKLDFAKHELFKCEKKVEAFESQISEEQYGAKVYKDVISKLNKSNEMLSAKNSKLKEETEALRMSAKALKSEVARFQRDQEEMARSVAGDSSNASSHSNSLEMEHENVVMKDLLQKSKNSVTDAKNMQKKLSNQVAAATKRESKLTKEIINLKAKNEEMEKRLAEQEQELDEFENDFALARNDARKVVEELRAQLRHLEKRNKKLEEASGGMAGIEELKTNLKALVQKNKRLQQQLDACQKRGGSGKLEASRVDPTGSSSRRCR